MSNSVIGNYPHFQYLMSGWWGSYSFRCQPVDYTNNPMALRVRRLFAIKMFKEEFANCAVTDGPNVLVVLFLEVHRVFRHALFHFAQENESRVDVARHSPRMHAFLGVDGDEVRSR